MLTYGAGSVSTRTYLDVAVGTAFETFTFTSWESGDTANFRGILSNPIWRLENIASPEINVQFPPGPGHGDTQPGTMRIQGFNASGLEMFSRITQSTIQDIDQDTEVGLFGVPFANGVQLDGFLPLAFSGTSAFIIPAGGGPYLRRISSLDGPDSANVNEFLSTQALVPVGATIPDRVDLVVALFYSRNLESPVGPAADANSPVAMTVGINANSSVTLTIGTEDGSTATNTLTQLPA